jgi:hypothetical protein
MAITRIEELQGYITEGYNILDELLTFYNNPDIEAALRAKDWMKRMDDDDPQVPDGKPEVRHPDSIRLEGEEDIPTLDTLWKGKMETHLHQALERVASLERDEAETQRQLESLAASCVIDTAHIAALEEIAHSHLDGVMGWTLSKPPAPADVDLDALMLRIIHDIDASLPPAWMVTAPREVQAFDLGQCYATGIARKAFNDFKAGAK